MAPFFETSKSFADVPITDDGVNTEAFLEASDDLVRLFDLLGVGIFSFVQQDLRSNIAGIRSRYHSHKDGSMTLEALVVTEVESGTRQSTACVVRLVRGLMFTSQALVNMQEDRDCELNVCFKRSYDTTLKHHHGWLIQSAVKLAIKAVPNRAEFYRRIAQGASHESLDDELAKWLEALGGIVTRMKTFLSNGGYGNV